jgi:hypothetical protein
MLLTQKVAVTCDAGGVFVLVVCSAVARPNP